MHEQVCAVSVSVHVQLAQQTRFERVPYEVRRNHDRQLISNFKAIVSAPVLDFSYGRGKRDHSKNVSWV